MKKLVKLIAILAVLVLAMGTLAGCGAEGSKKLVMATNAEFAPFEFVSKTPLVGEYDGIDVRIMNEIATAIGMELEISNMNFDSIVPAVKSGKADIGVAGMTVKPDRLENVDFTETYYVAMQTIIVNKDNTDINSAADLAGKIVGVTTGYTGDMAITKQNIAKEIKRYQKGIDSIEDLKNGRVDAVIIDSPVAANFIKKNDMLKGIEDTKFFEKEEYAMAIKKGNKELLEKINTEIKKMKESGRIEEIAAQY